MKPRLFLGALILARIAMAAPVCAPGQVVAGPAPFTTGNSVISGFSCVEGSDTFGNFSVSVLAAPFPVPVWEVSLGPDTSASAMVLGFGFTGLPLGDEFGLSFTIVPGVTSVTLGVGPGVTASEVICSAPMRAGGLCPGVILSQGILGASNGGFASVQVTPSAQDYAFLDVSGGSNVANTYGGAVPEPATAGITGLGLVGLCLVKARRRKEARDE
jgi:hypothetical protein